MSLSTVNAALGVPLVSVAVVLVDVGELGRGAARRGGRELQLVAEEDPRPRQSCRRLQGEELVDVGDAAVAPGEVGAVDEVAPDQHPGIVGGQVESVRHPVTDEHRNADQRLPVGGLGNVGGDLVGEILHLHLEGVGGGEDASGRWPIEAHGGLLAGGEDRHFFFLFAFWPGKRLPKALYELDLAEVELPPARPDVFPTHLVEGHGIGFHMTKKDHIDPVSRRQMIMSEVAGLADYLRGEDELTDEEIERIGQIDRLSARHWASTRRRHRHRTSSL